MGECRIDHSIDDVKKKFESQKEFIPVEMAPLFEGFFKEEHTQDILNELFHLLKKFDLAEEGEKQERLNKMKLILKNV